MCKGRHLVFFDQVRKFKKKKRKIKKKEEKSRKGEGRYMTIFGGLKSKYIKVVEDMYIYIKSSFNSTNLEEERTKERREHEAMGFGQPMEIWP